MINNFCDDWIREWCQDNGWTELFIERRNNYWAFPPNGVMPLPIPKETLLEIKAEKGFSDQEKLWLTIVSIVAIVAIIATCLFQCPMPLVCDFGFTAIVIPHFEWELD